MQSADLHRNVKHQVDHYLRSMPEGALLLRLGYFGTDSNALETFAGKKQCVMYISNGTTRDGETSKLARFTINLVPIDALVYIDMGLAFGDAGVELKGYPYPVLPACGVMKVVAYECVNVEVLTLLAHAPPK